LNDLPNQFNKDIVESDGKFNFGKYLWSSESSPYNKLSVDVSLDEDFRIYQNRLEFSINGTFFNKDRNY